MPRETASRRTSPPCSPRSSTPPRPAPQSRADRSARGCCSPSTRRQRFRYPRLPHLLTTARGNGIQLLLVYHDLAQVEHPYGGREVARTVVSNAKMRMLLPGVGDLETLRYWSDLMGRARTQTRGETRSADGRRSRSTNEHQDALAPLHQLQQLPDGEAVLLYQNLPPARVRLLPWYADRRFRASSPGGPHVTTERSSNKSSTRRH